MTMTEQSLDKILERYQRSFSDKVYSQENDELDPLMNVFGLSPQLKRENRQYWGRELGRCWQLLVVEVCKTYCGDFQPAFKLGNDEPCDLVVGNYAIDTKYRIGSGDSGTLKKFKSYGPLLRDRGYEPVFLILRKDNLPAAITACHSGNWNVYIGDESFEFIQNLSGFDLKSFLTERAGEFPVNR
ncbi:MAG: restriction endonuclease [Hormoscilla sp. GM102CHS1]|nr:restriction endonuclease [Hormoscilla sp. GM102CHS1]